MDLEEVAAEVIGQLGEVTAADVVWVNPSAGRTYRLATPGGTTFLKLTARDGPGTNDDAWAEADRLRWIGTAVPVPTVLATGRDDRVSWMLTRGLPGFPASDPRWRSDPVETARALGHAVRTFHDALTSDVARCPWSWRIADRLAARPDSREAAALAADAPEETDLVVGHGDMCAPNILLAEDGTVTGFVDVGRLGVADRSADLGCHAWSLEFNGLGAVVDEFLAAYGHPVDRAAVQWYRTFYPTA